MRESAAGSQGGCQKDRSAPDGSWCCPGDAFGSLARGDGFTPLSDIDLAVEGIAWSDYWRVFSEVSKLTSFGVDLVVLEDASPEFRRRIYLEGENLSHGC